MKIRMTFEFDARCRLALAHRVGDRRPATREDVENWITTVIDTTLQQITAEYDERSCEACEGTGEIETAFRSEEQAERGEELKKCSKCKGTGKPRNKEPRSRS